MKVDFNFVLGQGLIDVNGAGCVSPFARRDFGRAYSYGPRTTQFTARNKMSVSNPVIPNAIQPYICPAYHVMQYTVRLYQTVDKIM